MILHLPATRSCTFDQTPSGSTNQTGLASNTTMTQCPGARCAYQGATRAETTVALREKAEKAKKAKKATGFPHVPWFWDSPDQPFSCDASLLYWT